MNYNLLENIKYCQEFVLAASGLIYYSHATSAIVAICLGLFVYWKNDKSLLSRILLSLSVFYLLWAFLNLMIWSGYAHGNLIMFAWSQIEVFSIPLFFLSFYFIYVFIEDRDLNIRWKALAMLLLLPAVIYAATPFHLQSYDIQECISVEAETYMTYVKFLKISISLIIITYSSYKFYILRNRRREIVILTLGSLVFLYSFFLSSIISDQTVDYRYELYGLFGMIVFIGTLVYLIIIKQAFNIKVIAGQFLVIALIILTGSQLFFVRNTTSQILSVITLLFTSFFGYFLIKSVNKEVETSKYALSLAEDLSKSNDKLFELNKKLKELDRQKTEFVSMASHQLRTPLTAIKGYSSMLLEGSFGELSEKTKGAVDVIYQSSQRLVSVIEDFLNITRIELGKMKYDVTIFDIRDLVKNVTDELIPFAKRKKLNLVVNLGRGAYQVSADYGKMSQVVSNVIDNAIKYTPAGSVSVEVTKPSGDSKHIHINVKDTGVGIAAESIPKLFKKFIRADEVGKTHITGTGLGLYVVKQILDAHKGTISIESPGVGKGTTFSIVLNSYQETSDQETQEDISEFADSL
ncbi:MAG: HAMP domain-containing histidine kinase [Candidatus Vogelbacteria bacterium]|nr:HAMP domain-containing histidine kinase [Candidatus Vogelbacteria bacterium]